jgi:hypothetical protein
VRALYRTLWGFSGNWYSLSNGFMKPEKGTRLGVVATVPTKAL